MARYCFDTSSYIEPWVRRLPPDIFPGFWDGLDQLHGTGEIVSPVEVLHETERQKDDLHDWLAARPGLFVELDDDQQIAVREILGEFKELVKEHKRSSAADSFVIGLARVKGLTVVTEEGFGRSRQPKIPDVCRHYGIECINVVQFIRAQGWQFRGR